ncbi:pyridoxamine 5'-phosphate oxidase family protein [Streptomyces sp. NPDC097619]|uniref:pyridoxamine 5'-phosphate oxidase family protein n=1 Tax=Streptomyces sp. NPDC097619 TaxID=3157228 RepID=UPI003328BC6F
MNDTTETAADATAGTGAGTAAETGRARRVRTRAERRSDTLERLGTERDLWLATSHPEHGPHLLPLWFRWDGTAVWACTRADSPTVRNARAEPRVRLSLPHSYDVVLMEGEAACFGPEEAGAVPEEGADAYAALFGWDPRRAAAPYTYLRIAPRTVRAWHGEPELRGRLLMRDGLWLD